MAVLKFFDFFPCQIPFFHMGNSTPYLGAKIDVFAKALRNHRVSPWKSEKLPWRFFIIFEQNYDLVLSKFSSDLYLFPVDFVDPVKWHLRKETPNDDRVQKIWHFEWHFRASDDVPCCDSYQSDFWSVHNTLVFSYQHPLSVVILAHFLFKINPPACLSSIKSLFLWGSF